MDHSFFVYQYTIGDIPDGAVRIEEWYSKYEGGYKCDMLIYIAKDRYNTTVGQNPKFPVINRYFANSDTSIIAGRLNEHYGVSNSLLFNMFLGEQLTILADDIHTLQKKAFNIRNTIVDKLKAVVAFNKEILTEEKNLQDRVYRVDKGIKVIVKRNTVYNTYEDKICVFATFFLPANDKGELIGALVDKTGSKYFLSESMNANYVHHLLITKDIGVYDEKSNKRVVRIQHVAENPDAKKLDVESTINNIRDAESKSELYVKKCISTLKEIYKQNMQEQKECIER